MQYRAEIDGLRAIAVLSVIIFHAGLESLSGGFVGVDVFYVISGYLITRILVSDTEKGTFSFSEFYLRRIKRLMPAALVVILVTLASFSLILSPASYYELAKSAVASIFFIANFWFMENAGYFDTSTQIAPLVHMWSLAIEEQFYIIHPFIIVCLTRCFGINKAKLALLTLFATSFVASVALSEFYPDFAFYMLPTRAWELALGALIVFYPLTLTKKTATGVAALSAITLVTSFFIIHHNNIYPGYLALLPTASTFLLIQACHQENIIKRLLSLKALVFVGKISYSAYLWHWPIVVFYRIYINQRAFNVYEVVALTCVTLIVAFLSWKYIEERFRRPQYSVKTVYKNAGFAYVGLLSICVVILSTKGLPERFSDRVAGFTDKREMRKISCTNQLKLIDQIDETFCTVGDDWHSSDLRVVIWGDSHSQHWASILHSVSSGKSIAIAIAPRKCPAYIDNQLVRSYYPKYPRFNEDCKTRNTHTIEWINQSDDIDAVIFASAWSIQTLKLYNEEFPNNKQDIADELKDQAIGAHLTVQGLTATIQKIKKLPILLLSDVPRPNRDLNECRFAEEQSLFRQQCQQNYHYLDYDTVLKWHKITDNALISVADTFSRVSVIVPSQHLCAEGQCKTIINNQLIYRDEHHLRRNLMPATNIKIAEMLALDRYLSSLKH
ncbi:acyltransferase family protein [Thalassotalea agarivorans]|uniref:Peptidoglycan/LPS O-acetylase OafA/YrhL, contains acyltransferase and SGNH-hydrolase domains n=1 Tax=Thalassotalea agarivorans TaxID=349064 RepID=A0A1I0E821_THASX|nr:acyltransferase family protein [Thalassotalea agarivorans]SET41357.1 Peptidoglycan/LPS O-acetylase OafA/YrhL, contains acyltransferase and SGNH-hydrolase domains [Thalassotalea agarivorans]